MENRIAMIIFVISVYFGFMLISILILTSGPEEFESNSPLIDRKWKRISWVLSCLLLVPLLMAAMRGPRSLWGDVEDFIRNAESGKDDAGHQKQTDLFD